MLSTYDCLRFARINEADDYEEILNLFMDFLCAVDKGNYDQLNEDIEVVSFYLPSI